MVWGFGDWIMEGGDVNAPSVAELKRQLAEAQEEIIRLKRLNEEYRLTWNRAEDLLDEVQKILLQKATRTNETP